MINRYKNKGFRGSHWLKRKSLADAASEAILNHIKKKDKVSLLDAGCAEGRDTYNFHKKGFEAEGLDSNLKLIKEARKRYPQIHFSQGNIEDMPYPPESFDVIFCVNTLFLTDIKKSLPEIEKTLNKGGIAIITLDEKITNMDENKVIHSLDVEKALKLLKKSKTISIDKKERIDPLPYGHKHEYFHVIIKKIE
jgi:ubiquinone/menaquinone biosynthesis C-methylase UbiE